MAEREDRRTRTKYPGGKAVKRAVTLPPKLVTLLERELDRRTGPAGERPTFSSLVVEALVAKYARPTHAPTPD